MERLTGSVRDDSQSWREVTPQHGATVEVGCLHRQLVVDERLESTQRESLQRESYRLDGDAEVTCAPNSFTAHANCNELNK